MLTLGIETSCDETSCAVLKNRSEILSNVVSSSLFRHKPFGGVVPEIASRHCLEQIDVVFKEALRQARLKPKDLDLIAVTQGPGLIGSLLVGVCFAKALSYELKIPLVAVNHLEAHLVAPFISDKNGKAKKEPSRFLGLLVSGGHTSISYHNKGKVKLLGETVDDAVGEAYDKVAKILGLGYPGGPIIDRLAKEGNPAAFRFTKPKQDNPFDFSFSGIKTAVLYEVQKYTRHSEATGRRISKYRSFAEPVLSRHSAQDDGEGLRMTNQNFIRDMAASFQSAVVRWLVEKTLAAAAVKKVKAVIVGGGVSANSHLREMLIREGQRQGLDILFPPFSLTTDNAAMIARRGVELYRERKTASLKLTGNPNLHIAA
jgi:N6-L-threonylcarbamoyladenine synthase